MSALSDFQTRLAFQKLHALITGAAGIGGEGVDPTNHSGTMRTQRAGGYTIENGIILETRVGAYDFLVKIGKRQVPCNLLRSQSTQGFGVATADLPVEGSCVFVLVKKGFWGYGWILGVEPRAWHLPIRGMKRQMFKNYPQGDLNPFEDNIAYKIPETDKQSTKRVWSDGELYSDLLPGETACTNENRCGVVTTMYDVELCGGGSFIRVCRLDDEIRMRSTNFTKWTHHEAVHEFNDYGLISAENREYSYQGELYGGEGQSGDKMEKLEDTEDKKPRPRTRTWKGFLGNFFSKFFVRAGKSKDEDDETLASVHVSQAGNVMVRSAGGVSFERYDAIPTPRRLKEEWDPQGDKEKDASHEAIKPFNVDDPHSMGLLKSSKMAWEQKAMYQRFDELKQDFKVQEESEVKIPGNDDQDPFGSQELKLDEYRGRRAGVFIGDDGSVIIRDAWGSEIVMVGGNVCINTPGNVITTANRNIVSIAGDSAIVNGKKAADISSEDGHARMHAKKLVEIAGGTDETPGGVLIESLGDSMSVDAKEGDEGGDAASIGGIVIRTEKSGVSVSGKNTYVTAKDTVFVTTGPDGDTREGNVNIDTGTMMTTVDKSATIVCEKTGCYIAKKSAFLVSDEGSAIVHGKSATIINGSQVPKEWTKADDPDFSWLKDIWEEYQKSDLIKPYTWDEMVEKAVFSFRKAVDAKTNTGIEPWQPNGEFCLYEPYWQVLKELGVDTVTSEPEEMKAEEVHKTKCWPYKDAFDSGKFVTVSSGSINLELGDGGPVSKGREGLQDTVSVEKKGFDEFKV